jgi:hypothetical protein
MSLQSDYADYMAAHVNILVAYKLLTEKKTKSKAPELRKALQASILASKSMRKSAQAFKEKI